MSHSGTNRLEAFSQSNKPDLLQALSRLDTELSKYARYKQEATDKLWQTGVKKYTQRTQALEQLRQTILNGLVEEEYVDAVRIVEVANTPFYCLSIGSYLFFTPVDEWDDQISENGVVDGQSSNGVSGVNSSIDMTEREALELLSTWFESPNYYIDDPFGDAQQDDPFVGWSYLPGAVEWGDKVPEWLLEKHNELDEFIFEVGDVFQTVKGECEIMNRYYAYFTPWMRDSPIKPLPVYDVWLEGEKLEAVRAGCIIDDWCIVAESVSDPVPGVDGRFGEIAGSVLDSLEDGSTVFEIGDVLEIESDQSTHAGDEDTEYYQLDAVYVSGLSLIGDYIALGDADEMFAQSIREIADDVVSVYDSIPA